MTLNVIKHFVATLQLALVIYMDPQSLSTFSMARNWYSYWIYVVTELKLTNAS